MFLALWESSIESILEFCQACDFNIASLGCICSSWVVYCRPLQPHRCDNAENKAENGRQHECAWTDHLCIDIYIYIMIYTYIVFTHRFVYTYIYIYIYIATRESPAMCPMESYFSICSSVFNLIPKISQVSLSM